MADREVKCTVLKVISEKKGRNIVQIRIVKWNELSPTLEKRELWYDEGDNEKTGKAKGFNADDFKTLLANAEEIQKLLSSTV